MKIAFFLFISVFISVIASSQLKEPLYGLAIRDYEKVGNMSDDLLKNIHTVVIKVDWRDIQEKEGGEIKRDNIVDEAITWVRSYNKKNNADIGLKLRLYGGSLSPDWLIEKAGYFTGEEQRFPKFWNQIYIDAFADVQAKLAAIYDDMPEIREVVNGGTGLGTAENFIRPFVKGEKGKTAMKLFHEAGYNASADSFAIVKSYESMKVWKKTRVSICFSQWRTLDRDGHLQEDINRTFPFIKRFVDELGSQAVIGNNGLRTGYGSKGYRWQEGGAMSAIYQYMKKMHDEKGVQVYFQTAINDRIGSLREAIDDGIRFGASYIELPMAVKSFEQNLPFSQMPDVNRRLKENLK